MKTFTAFEYLLMDIAVHAGHDKMTWEDRLQWTIDNIHQLEKLEITEEPLLYAKAVYALRRAQRGLPINHIMHLDAVCSGIQILSALTGCHAGAKATGLINTGKRPDAYTDTNNIMQDIVGEEIEVNRKDTKKAVMTSVYGSTATPREVFGEGSTLEAFYKAVQIVAPGAFQMLEDLRATWIPGALEHAWILPDGFNAKVKVIETVSKRLEIDELNHHSVTAEFKINKGSEYGLSNIANVTHSIDAYVLRSVVRFCSYDKGLISNVRIIIMSELAKRLNNLSKPSNEPALQHMINIAEQTKIADIRLIEFLDVTNAGQFPKWILKSLLADIDFMLTYEPFDVVTIHDSFGCLPSKGNTLRYWYNEIMARLAESDLMQWIFRQLFKDPKLTFDKLSNDLAGYIRKADYPIC